MTELQLAAILRVNSTDPDTALTLAESVEKFMKAPGWAQTHWYARARKYLKEAKELA